MELLNAGRTRRVKAILLHVLRIISRQHRQSATQSSREQFQKRKASIAFDVNDDDDDTAGEKKRGGLSR
jgi:hypothetical protein